MSRRSPWSARRHCGIAVIALLSAAAGAAAQPGHGGTKAPPPAFADPARRAKLAAALPEIERIFRDFAERSRVPGIAWGVIVDGELVQLGTAGYRDIEAKAPVEADTVFRIASMTKSFTAMAIMKLRDEGKLSLDDPAERYVPEMAGLVYPTTDSPRVTIRHLLSHAEGFPEDNPWGDQQLAATDAEMSAMIRSGIPFSRAPGVAYEYSNFGFAILGRIVARVSGMAYADYVAASILRPLGMTSTTLERALVPSGRLARGYRWEDDRWKDEPLLPDGAFGPMGGMLTSIADLSRYVGFYLSAWPPRDGPETGPIRRASAREMQQVWRPAPASVTARSIDGPVALNAGGYGFGLRVSQTCEFGHVVAHSGGLPGFGSQMRWLPDHGVGVVALGNLTYTGWGPVVDRAIEALARTGALRPRVPQPAPALLELRDAVSRLVSTWDDRLAAEVAAVNLFLDESADRRRRQFEAFRARHGACLPEPGIDAENALRGQWTMQCERGWLRVAITLSPTVPPKVQHWSVRSVMPPGTAMSGVLARLVPLIGGGEGATTGVVTGRGATRAVDPPAASARRAEIGSVLDAVLAASVDRAAVDRLLAASVPVGRCQVTEVLDGDGDRAARLRLSCDRGAIDLTVGLEEKTGRVSRLSIAPAGNNACR